MLNNLTCGTDAAELSAGIKAAFGVDLKLPTTLGTATATLTKGGFAKKPKEKSARIKKPKQTANVVQLANVAHEHRAHETLGPLLQAPQLGVRAGKSSARKTKTRPMAPANFAAMVKELLDPATKRRVREGICHALVNAWVGRRLTPLQRSAVANYFVGFEERGVMLKSVAVRAERTNGLAEAMAAIRNGVAPS